MLYIRQTKKMQVGKNKRVDKEIPGIYKLKEGRGLNLLCNKEELTPKSIFCCGKDIEY